MVARRVCVRFSRCPFLYCSHMIGGLPRPRRACSFGYIAGRQEREEETRVGRKGGRSLPGAHPTCDSNSAVAVDAAVAMHMAHGQTSIPLLRTARLTCTQWTRFHLLPRICITCICLPVPPNCHDTCPRGAIVSLLLRKTSQTVLAVAPLSALTAGSCFRSSC